MVKWSKFSGGSWTAEGKGFFYAGYGAPKSGEELKGELEGIQIRYHVLGSADPRPRRLRAPRSAGPCSSAAATTEDGRYLILTESKGGAKNNLSLQDLQAAPAAQAPVAIATQLDAEYDVIGNKGAVFYVRTNLDAPRFRVIAINLAMPDRASWKEVVPQAENTLAGASLVGDRPGSSPPTSPTRTRS